jgi:hypothetical protein
MFLRFDLQMLKDRTVEYLNGDFGGAEKWKGPDLYSSHCYFSVKQEHWDVMFDYIRIWLVKNNIEDNIAANIMARLETMRGPIVDPDKLYSNALAEACADRAARGLRPGQGAVPCIDQNVMNDKQRELLILSMRKKFKIDIEKYKKNIATEAKKKAAVAKAKSKAQAKKRAASTSEKKRSASLPTRILERRPSGQMRSPSHPSGEPGNLEDEPFSPPSSPLPLLLRGGKRMGNIPEASSALASSGYPGLPPSPGSPSAEGATYVGAIPKLLGAIAVAAVEASLEDGAFEAGTSDEHPGLNRAMVVSRCGSW